MSKIASAQLRVSSAGQYITGASPARQKERILIRADKFSINDKEVHLEADQIEFIPLHQPATGEWDEQAFHKAIQWHKDNPQAKYHLFSQIDRSTRGGGPIFFRLKEVFAKMGVYLVDAEGIIGNSVVNKFAKYGKNYPKFMYDPSENNQWEASQKAKSYVIDSIGNATLAGMDYLYAGYWFSGQPTGYRAVRVEAGEYGRRLILVKDEIDEENSKQANWIIKMYELRAQGNLSDDGIVKELNSLGYKTKLQNKRDPETLKKIGITGGNPLDKKSMLYKIENVINAGIICNERTNFHAIRGKGFIPLVSVDLWNRANRGKHEIVEDGDNVTVLRNKPAEFLLRKDKDNPTYAHRTKLKCHILLKDGSMCGHPLKGSAPKNKRGIPFPCFHCSHNHKWWSVNKNVFDRVILNLVSQIKLNDEFKVYFKAYALEEIYKRRLMAIDNSASYQELVGKLTRDKENLAKNLSELMKQENLNLTLVNLVQQQYDKIEVDIAEAKSNRTKVEKEEVDIEKLIKYCYYFIDNLKELLFTEDKPFQNADFFGLLFAETPTFKDLWHGTPLLDPIFSLNESFSKVKLEDLVKDKNTEDRTPYFKSISRLIQELEEPQTNPNGTSVPRPGVEPG